MENLLILNLFIKLSMYYSVEKGLAYCVVIGTHVDKNRLWLLSNSYA